MINEPLVNICAVKVFPSKTGLEDHRKTRQGSPLGSKPSPMETTTWQKFAQSRKLPLLLNK